MRAPRTRAIAITLGLAVVAAACGDERAPDPETPKGSEEGAGGDTAGGDPSQPGTGDPDTPSAGAPAGPALADEPDIDLVDNRVLWHLYSSGLEVPMASPGLWKYTQEYKRPWGGVVTHDGRAGRVLENRTATLRVPYEPDGDAGGGATLLVRAHGLTGGQKLDVFVNGKRAGGATLAPSWGVTAVSIAPGLLRRGENDVRLWVKKRAAAAGKRSYALFHSLSLAAGKVEATAAYPPLTPARAFAVGGDERASLGGFSRMVMYVEIPEKAHLVFATGVAEGAGDVGFTVTARTADGDEATLFEHRVTSGWREQRVSLDELAGHLVALELAHDAAEDQAAWGGPRIALEEAPSAELPAYQNTVLVVVDALRPDRLSIYGDTRVRTPRMTKLWEERGIVMQYNQGASPSSPPSHASIQTGMIPRVHGVVGDKADLDKGTPMVSTQLEAAGVATAYYGNNPFGMGRLEKPGGWTAFHQPNKEGKGIDCTVLMDEMLGFAEQQTKKGKRFFISSLPYETHTPYRYHEEISDRFYDGPWDPPVGKSAGGELLGALGSGKATLNDRQWKQLKALYDGEAEYMDGCFGQLLDGLDELGVLDDTLVVLTSDHGEGMFEHGKMGHAFGHYAELANVPLVFYGKGLTSEGRKVHVVSSHLDITPTILELMGAERSERIQGRSLVPILARQGPWTPRVLPLEYGRSYALRSARWKLIVDYAGNEEVYDLDNDPTEQKDLAGKNDTAHRYLRDLAGLFLEYRKEWKMETWGELNDHAAGFLDHIGATEAR